MKLIIIKIFVLIDFLTLLFPLFLRLVLILILRIVLLLTNSVIIFHHKCLHSIQKLMSLLPSLLLIIAFFTKDLVIHPTIFLPRLFNLIIYPSIIFTFWFMWSLSVWKTTFYFFSLFFHSSHWTSSSYMHDLWGLPQSIRLKIFDIIFGF